jgi:SNF2 family DNA or RNA helicase
MQMSDTIMQKFIRSLTAFPFLFFRLVKQGKTIQTIATILDNRPKLQHSRPGAKHPPSSPDLEALVKEEALWKTALAEWNNEMEMNNVPKKILPKNRGGARAGTLVVCPVIALSQWKSEIEKFTETDTLTVGIYHGPNRAKEMPAEMMQKYDIVLTTYQVLEQDFRKMVSPNKGKFREEVLRLPLIAVLAA